MKQIYLLLFVLTLLNSCNTLDPFTDDLYDRSNWTEPELRRIQFYLSDDIVLRRALSGTRSEINNGEIKIIDGERVEQVVIPKGTPGALINEPKEKRFQVAFEQEDSKFLMFGPSPRARGRFVLLARDWDRRQGIVTYDGKLWKVGSNSAYAALMVDLKEIQDRKVKSRRASGRKVNN